MDTKQNGEQVTYQESPHGTYRGLAIVLGAYAAIGGSVWAAFEWAF